MKKMARKELIQKFILIKLNFQIIKKEDNEKECKFEPGGLDPQGFQAIDDDIPF